MLMMKYLFSIIILFLFYIDLFAEEVNKTNAIDSGDTAWMLISTALVILMTPAG